jgi:hypothetical protein
MMVFLVAVTGTAAMVVPAVFAPVESEAAVTYGHGDAAPM